MYISEIDDILDQTLDKFMYSWAVENNLKELISFEKLIKEPNFIKYQKDINFLDLNVFLANLNLSFTHMMCCSLVHSTELSIAKRMLNIQFKFVVIHCLNQHLSC